MRRLDWLKEKLESEFKDAIVEINFPRHNRVVVKVINSKIIDVARFLRDNGFDMPVSSGAVDYLREKKFEVFWIIWSSSYNVILILKTDIDREKPEVSSLVDIWRGVQKFERETWELMGVKFEGHPKLKRLLLPEDWDYSKEGYPLRKDFFLKRYGD